MRSEQTIKRLRRRALMVSRFAYDAHFQRLHEAESFEHFDAECIKLRASKLKEPIPQEFMDQLWKRLVS